MAVAAHLQTVSAVCFSPGFFVFLIMNNNIFYILSVLSLFLGLRLISGFNKSCFINFLKFAFVGTWSNSGTFVQLKNEKYFCIFNVFHNTYTAVIAVINV